MTVRLHIDRLVVDASIAADTAALEAQVTAALAAALTTGPRPDWWQGTIAIGDLRAALPPGNAATQGTSIGAAIHDCLARPPSLHDSMGGGR